MFGQSESGHIIVALHELSLIHIYARCRRPCNAIGRLRRRISLFVDHWWYLPFSLRPNLNLQLAQ